MKDACWLYLGSISGNSGYGQIEYRLDKNVCCKMGVHVLMLRAATMQTIPLYHQANHLCEVRSCANPDHIYIGTQERNMNDMVARGCARDQGTLIMECSAQIHLRKAMGKPIPRYYQKMAKLFKFDHILEGASLEGE